MPVNFFEREAIPLYAGQRMINTLPPIRNSLPIRRLRTGFRREFIDGLTLGKLSFFAPVSGKKASW